MIVQRDDIIKIT